MSKKDLNPYIAVVDDNEEKARAELDAIADYCRENMMAFNQSGGESDYDPLPEFLAFLHRKPSYRISEKDTVVLIFCEIALVNGISLQFPRGDREEIREFIKDFFNWAPHAVDFAIHLSSWERYRVFAEDYSITNH